MTKSIPLTQGKFALVDDEDYERVNAHKWYYAHGYAVRNTPGRNGVLVHMHREVIGTPGGMETDHVNMIALDNRKANLRVCTHEENLHNRNVQANSTSGFKGVSPRKDGKWRARISVGGRRIHIGDFAAAEDAARAYNDAARKYHGEYARVNL